MTKSEQTPGSAEKAPPKAPVQPRFTPLVVDLYHGSSVQSMASVQKAGIIGVIHKSTQGLDFDDKRYALRRVAARDAGLLWGAYHFATGEPVASQIEHFLRYARPGPETLLALDFERNPHGSTMSPTQCVEFLRRVEAAMGGRKAVLYGGDLIKESMAQVSLEDKQYLSTHRLWLAQYGPRPVVPAPWEAYWLWQYSGDGKGPEPHRIDGIAGTADLSTYAGSREKLAREWSPLPLGFNEEPTS